LRCGGCSFNAHARAIKSNSEPCAAGSKEDIKERRRAKRRDKIARQPGALENPIPHDALLLDGLFRVQKRYAVRSRCQAVVLEIVRSRELCGATVQHQDWSSTPEHSGACLRLHPCNPVTPNVRHRKHSRLSTPGRSAKFASGSFRATSRGLENFRSRPIAALG